MEAENQPIQTESLGEYTRRRDEISVTEEYPSVEIEDVAPLTAEYATAAKKTSELRERLQNIHDAIAEYQALDEARHLPDDNPDRAQTVAARENDFAVLLKRAGIKHTTDAPALFELNQKKRTAQSELGRELKNTYTALAKQAELLAKAEQQLKQGADVRSLLEEAAFTPDQANLLKGAGAEPAGIMRRFTGWNRAEMSAVHAALAGRGELPREVEKLQAVADAAAERRRRAEEQRQRDLEAAGRISKLIQEELPETPPSQLAS